MRKIIFWMHLVTGVAAGVVIFIMSVTGVLLMYQKQVTAWADGGKVRPPENGSRLPVQTLLAKLREKESGEPSAVTVYSDPRRAAGFTFGRDHVVFVDPYTGAVIGEGSKAMRGFFRLMIDWHRWLGTSTENRAVGKAITGACNLGFLFLVVSGLYLWCPRNWNFRSLRAGAFFDWSLAGKARDWNWHNVAGFWMAIPLFFVVATATFFSYPWATPLLSRALGETPPPKATAPPRGKEPSAAKAAFNGQGLNSAWALAEEELPGWKSISLRMPASSHAPLSFTIDQGNGARPDLRAMITVDGATGEIKKRETYEGYSPARKVRLWVRWLHTGEAGGFIGQTIAGVASGAGALLVWTGLALAFRRFFKRKEGTAA